MTAEEIIKLIDGKVRSYDIFIEQAVEVGHPCRDLVAIRNELAVILHDIRGDEGRPAVGFMPAPVAHWTGEQLEHAAVICESTGDTFGAKWWRDRAKKVPK